MNQNKYKDFSDVSFHLNKVRGYEMKRIIFLNKIRQQNEHTYQNTVADD